MKAPGAAIVMPSDKPRNNYANAWLEWEEYGAWYKEVAQNVPLIEIDVPETWSNAKLRDNVEHMEQTKKTRPVRISKGNTGKYVISDGIHRCNAARQLGYDAVPAIVSVEMRTPPPPAKGIDKLREERAGWNLYLRMKREYPLDWGNVKPEGDGFVVVAERDLGNEELSWKIKYNLNQGVISANMSGSSSGSANGKLDEVAVELARIMSWTKGKKAMSIKRKMSKVAGWLMGMCKFASWADVFGPEYDVPREILDLVARGKLKDTSWGNDICPSFMTLDEKLQLWVDHPDPEQREEPSYPRFGVNLLHADGSYDSLASTDNLGEALAAMTQKDKPTNSVEDIKTKLYDLQKARDPESMRRAQELLSEWQSLTGTDKPVFWQGQYPRRQP